MQIIKEEVSLFEDDKIIKSISLKGISGAKEIA